MDLYAVGSDSMASGTAVPSNVHLAEFETPVPVSIGQWSANASKPMEVPDNTPSENIDEVEPLEVDSDTSLVSDLSENDEKFVSVHKLRRENYQRVNIVINLHQATEVPYPLREVQVDHKQKLRVSIDRNGYDCTKNVSNINFRTILDGNANEIEALLLDYGVNESWKHAIQVTFVDGWHQFAALSRFSSAEERHNCQSEGL